MQTTSKPLEKTASGLRTWNMTQKRQTFNPAQCGCHNIYKKHKVKTCKALQILTIGDIQIKKRHQNTDIL